MSESEPDPFFDNLTSKKLMEIYKKRPDRIRDYKNAYKKYQEFLDKIKDRLGEDNVKKN